MRKFAQSSTEQFYDTDPASPNSQAIPRACPNCGAQGDFDVISSTEKKDEDSLVCKHCGISFSINTAPSEEILMERIERKDVKKAQMIPSGSTSCTFCNKLLSPEEVEKNKAIGVLNPTNMSCFRCIEEQGLESAAPVASEGEPVSQSVIFSKKDAQLTPGTSASCAICGNPLSEEDMDTSLDAGIQSLENFVCKKCLLDLTGEGVSGTDMSAPSSRYEFAKKTCSCDCHKKVAQDKKQEIVNLLRDLPPEEMAGFFDELEKVIDEKMKEGGNIGTQVSPEEALSMATNAGIGTEEYTPSGSPDSRPHSSISTKIFTDETVPKAIEFDGKIYTTEKQPGYSKSWNLVLKGSKEPTKLWINSKGIIFYINKKVGKVE